MSSSYGENIHLTLFGQSHSAAVGMTLEGIPAGQSVDFEALTRFLARRAPGKNDLSTARTETDEPEFLSGFAGNTTCGAPISGIIRNQDVKSADYEAYRNIPRPGHADYTAAVKYAGHQDDKGGGHFSGRLTAPLCMAGGICLQLLAKENIRIMARIRSVGLVTDDSVFSAPVCGKAFPVTDDEKAEAMKACILQAKAEGDSVGGVVECVAGGLPVGLGDPMFDGLENRIAQIVFAVPAVKGIEFGDGFALAAMRGSAANDAYYMDHNTVRTRTNHCGGILGGISDGMPLVFRAAFKPTPSIAQQQESVCLTDGTSATLSVRGRHDPCIVPRAVPCIEAAAAIAIYDALLSRRREYHDTF